MKKSIFITGTDTNIGKTVVSLFLLKAISSYQKKIKLSYFKPIQSGNLEETDSDYIYKYCGKSVRVEKETYSFRLPISPNRAAMDEKKEIELDKIKKDLNAIDCEICVLEGAGGVQVPINETQKILDIPKLLNVPILIVASTKLGTINHTFLTVESAKINGLNIMGIILNGDRDLGLRELIEKETSIPVIGEVPRVENIGQSLNDTVSFFNASFISNLVGTPFLKAEVSEKDHIWYPFTQHKIRKNNHKVIRGKGAFLYLESGKKVFDAISSWWVNLHGHGHPQIAKEIYSQALTLEHTILSGLNHDPAKKLSGKLIELTRKSGGDFEKVFFSDNGSTSVEVALKIAFQYSKNKGTGRKKFLSLRGSYHGDTFGAMSVSDPDSFHKTFNELLFEVDFISPDNFEELSEIEKGTPQEYAAFIVEPLIQGAGGMSIYSEAFLREVRLFCTRNNILLIFDEVFTGLGRLGDMFAFSKASVIPDILCLSKGISGGFLPISTTLVCKKIFNEFLSDKIDHAFLHGHSYTGNPLAAAASLASLEILGTKECQNAILKIEEVTTRRIKRLSENVQVENARSIGTIGAINLKGKGGYFSSKFSYDFFESALEKGVLLRPLGNVIYTVPPYCSRSEDLDYVYDVIEELVNEYK